MDLGIALASVLVLVVVAMFLHCETRALLGALLLLQLYPNPEVVVSWALVLLILKGFDVARGWV